MMNDKLSSFDCFDEINIARRLKIKHWSDLILSSKQIYRLSRVDSSCTDSSQAKLLPFKRRYNEIHTWPRSLEARGGGGEGRGVVRDKRSVLFTAEPKNRYTYPFFFCSVRGGGGEGISFVLFPQPSLL